MATVTVAVAAIGGIIWATGDADKESQALPKTSASPKPHSIDIRPPASSHAASRSHSSPRATPTAITTSSSASKSVPSTPPATATPTTLSPTSNPAVPPPPSAATEPPFGEVTWLVSQQSGKCADVGLEGAGANLYQWVCADGVSNQLWRLRTLRQGVYQFKNQHSEQCLTMLPKSGQLDVVQEPCSATSAQQQWNFQVLSAEKGWTGGTLRNERWGKCLDDSQASMEDGADLGPWDCATGQLNQMFRVHSYAR